METYATLLVGHTLGILELSGQRDLDLAELRHLRLGLLQLAEQVGVLNAQLLLGSIEIVQSAVGLVQLALNLVDVVRQLLGDLLSGGLIWKKYTYFRFYNSFRQSFNDK